MPDEWVITVKSEGETRPASDPRRRDKIAFVAPLILNAVNARCLRPSASRTLIVYDAPPTF